VEVAAVEPVRGAPSTAETRGPQGAQALLEGAAMEGSRHGEEKPEVEERGGAEEPVHRRREPRFVVLRADSKPSAVDLSSHDLDLAASSVAPTRQLRETAEEGASRHGARAEHHRSRHRAHPLGPRCIRRCGGGRGGEDGRGRERPRGWRRRPEKKVAADGGGGRGRGGRCEVEAAMKRRRTRGEGRWSRVKRPRSDLKVVQNVGSTGEKNPTKSGEKN
jgi:hypothetical protein